MTIDNNKISRKYTQCICIYYIICSSFNLFRILYYMLVNDITKVGYLIMVFAFIYLFSIITISVYSYNGSNKALALLKISILLQILYIHVDSIFYKMQNGFELTMDVLFVKNFITYTFSYTDLAMDLQFSLKDDHVNYIGINMIPLLFFVVFIILKKRNNTNLSSLSLG